MKLNLKFTAILGLILVMSMVIAACGGDNTQESNEAPGTLPETGGGITSTLPGPTSPITGTMPLSPSTGLSGTLPSPTSSVSTGMTSTTGLSSTMGAGEPITVTAVNNMFSTDAITATAGSTVVIEFTNMDAVPHNIAIYKDNTLAEKIYVGDIITGPNQSVTYTFTAPSDTGTYYFQCDVHPEQMNGQFIVQ